MDFSQNLTARQLADSLGLREMDFEGLKPGMPRTSGTVKLSAAADGSFAIDAPDREGNRIGLKVQRDGKEFRVLHGEFAPKGGVTAITKPDDLHHAASAIKKMRLGQENHTVAAMTVVLRDAGQLRAGDNAHQWAFKKDIENFHATAGQPMRFEKPTHLPSTSTPSEITKYHLGNGFTSAATVDGGRTYTYVSDTQVKEKLVLTADKTGAFTKVELNGKELPATRETQATVVRAAQSCAIHTRKGDVRNNPTITSTLQTLLSNEFRHHGLEGGKDADAYVSRLAERKVAPVVAAPAAAAAQSHAPAKPAAPATPHAKPATPTAAFKSNRGYASVGALVTTAALGLASVGLAKAESSGLVDMSAMRARVGDALGISDDKPNGLPPVKKPDAFKP